MNGELSEYERQRLENIKQNQEILRSLNIKAIVPEELKNPPAKAKHVAAKRKIAAVEVLLEKRQSSRLRNKELGLSALNEDHVNVIDTYKSAIREAPSKPKRIVGKIAYNPEDGATDGFLGSTASLDYSPCDAFTYETQSKNISGEMEIQNEHSVVKVMRERIYSIAIHPDPKRLLICAGGKFGQLAFLDATEASHPNGLSARTLPEPEEYTPSTYLFQPHTGSIPHLRYNPVNSQQLFSVSYDNLVRCMDLKKGSFDELFNFGESSKDVITGFDLSSRADVFYFSDTAGIFKFSDRRAGKDMVEEYQLHEKKIGSVSVCYEENLLATASNDGSVCIWDLRRLSKVEPQAVHKLHFKRSVTSAYFHPQDTTKLISTCYDDNVRIHYNMNRSMEDHRHVELSHNNQTGRWITNFKACWDPKSDMAVVGNMNRGIDLISSKDGRITRNITSEWLTSQPAVNAFHPNLDVVVSGNASGKIALWTAAS